MYVCSRCGALICSPHLCIECGNQANNFYYKDQIYKYKILENEFTEEIFKPIELLKEESENKDE